jgi:hypothetical protein
MTVCVDAGVWRQAVTFRKGLWSGRFPLFWPRTSPRSSLGSLARAPRPRAACATKTLSSSPSDGTTGEACQARPRPKIARTLNLHFLSLQCCRGPFVELLYLRGTKRARRNVRCLDRVTATAVFRLLTEFVSLGPVPLNVYKLTSFDGGIHAREGEDRRHDEGAAPRSPCSLLELFLQLSSGGESVRSCC